MVRMRAAVWAANVMSCKVMIIFCIASPFVLYLSVVPARGLDAPEPLLLVRYRRFKHSSRAMSNCDTAATVFTTAIISSIESFKRFGSFFPGFRRRRGRLLAIVSPPFAGRGGREGLSIPILYLTMPILDLVLLLVKPFLQK